MKAATIRIVITVLLLAFVGVSVAYAVAKELRAAGARPAAGVQPAAPAAPLAAAPLSAAAGDTALKAQQPFPDGTTFRATYYHGNTRCPTCVKIEAYSKECYKQRFVKELKSGKLVFSIVNYDEKGNEHYYKDYKLASQSLVVSAVKDGKELRYEILAQVWDLTYDKAKFMEYVEGATRAFMSGPPASSEARTGGLPQAGGAAQAVAPGPAGRRTLVAYYFHGDARCPSCLKIEAYTAAAIKENFDQELKDGRLSWQVINIDQPENRHFVGDYQLTTKSVVLSDRYGNEERNWKNLDRVWELLKDEPEFKDYIATEIGAALGPQ